MELLILIVTLRSLNEETHNVMTLQGITTTF